MARARTIFIVTRPGEDPAAFTVKHELVTWLHLLRRGQPLLPEGLRILRCDDGVAKRPPREVPLLDLTTE
jgi:hypothetical protein